MRYFWYLSFLLLPLFIVVQPQARPQEDSPAKLGEDLFHDPILSLDSTQSCASCHRPDFAFADTLALSIGVAGKAGTRNTPSVMNVAWRPYFFWDGRSPSLEAQALEPIKNPMEMNLPIPEAIARLQGHAGYRQRFEALYEEGVSPATLGAVLAAFQRTLETGSPFDRYMQGDEAAIIESAKRGLTIFNEKGKCFDCHFGPDMTGDEFRNIGLFDGEKYTDVGRFAETGDSSDLGKFRTPGLRNIAITAPYMHDGSMATLREVIEYYNTPTAFVPQAHNRDSLLSQPLGLSEQDMIDLENYLISLTADRYWEQVEWKQ